VIEMATSTYEHITTTRTWAVVAAVEVLLGAFVVLADLGIPTLVLLFIAGVGLGLRRQGLGSLGLHAAAALPLAAKMLAFAVAWSLFQLAVTMPVANHLSGSKQDLSAFDGLEGNVGMLLTLLLLSWTLAAFGEELAYRGFLLTRCREVFGSGILGTAVAVLATSLLFGFAHSEQGAIGVLVVSLDAVAFCLLRLHYGTLWAPVLAHGFINTLGFLAFFFVGPIYGLW
jgi:membrane protease YdiL (CAAX protease family)